MLGNSILNSKNVGSTFADYGPNGDPYLIHTILIENGIRLLHLSFSSFRFLF